MSDNFDIFRAVPAVDQLVQLKILDRSTNFENSVLFNRDFGKEHKMRFHDFLENWPHMKKLILQSKTADETFDLLQMDVDISIILDRMPEKQCEEGELNKMLNVLSMLRKMISDGQFVKVKRK